MVIIYLNGLLHLNTVNTHFWVSLSQPPAIFYKNLQFFFFDKTHIKHDNGVTFQNVMRIYTCDFLLVPALMRLGLFERNDSTEIARKEM